MSKRSEREKFIEAIAQQESGGNYSDVNSGSGALGRYQVMPSNVAAWTKEALGHSLTPEQYLHDPKAQDKVAETILGGYFDKYGAAGAASAWYSGNPSLATSTAPQSGGPSVADYVNSVLSKMGNPKLTASTSTSGSSAGTQDISPQEIRQGLNSMGFASQLIHSNKSLQKAFEQIIHEQLDLSSTAGATRATQILQNTAWFQNHTKAQRQFDEVKYSDPAQFAETIKQQRDSLKSEAEGLGISLDPNDLDHLAHMITRNGLTSDEVNQLLSKHVNLQAGQAYTGTVGNTIDALRQGAASYYVPVSEQQLQHYTRQVVAGNLDPSSINNVFKQQALSLFPYLKTQLDAGHTVADIADSYKQMMAQTLELDPNGIKYNDPLIMKGLQTTNTDGTQGLMPLWQYQQKLYDDPRWLQTQNAHQSLVGTTGQILQKMGVIV